MANTSGTPTRSERLLRALGRPLVIPALALVTALLSGAMIMLLSGDNPVAAYRGLLEGAFGGALAISRTLRSATPLLLTGLSVAFAFKAGLFNIGASGQLLMGSISSAAVAILGEGLPAAIHLPLALLAGALGGALWGAIPGLLKAWRGAHEVITTIMLNYIASLFTGWMVYAGGTEGQQPGPLSDPTGAARGISRTPLVPESARLPELLPDVLSRVHWGIVIALAVAALVWWVLRRSNYGFEIRTVGANPAAARYAGIRVNRTIVTTMAVAGALAGLAGTVDTLGLNFRYAPEFTGGAGFEGITIALLGKTDPWGVAVAALLIGALYGGAGRMQLTSGVRSEIIQVVQALILMFVAAPEIVRVLYRIRQRRPEDEIAETTLTSGWGG